MPRIPASTADASPAQPQAPDRAAAGGAPAIPASPAADTSPAAASPTAGTSADMGHAQAMARFNEAGVRSAQANWLDGINTLLYAPDSGYLSQRGAAAMGGYDPVQQAMGKLTQQAQDSLANDTQRGIFAQATGPMLAAIQARIQQHAQDQGRVYDADASRARAQAARDLAVNAWNPAPGADNSGYRQCAAIVHNELENQFRHAWGEPGAGDNSNLWDHYLQHGPNGDDGMASVSTGVVNRLLANGQPHDAQAFLSQVQHTLPAPTRDKLSQFVTAALDQHAGLSAALQAQAASNDPVSNDAAGKDTARNDAGGADTAAQQQRLDALRDDGRISNEAHAIASHKIQADAAARAATRQQNDTQTLQRVWDLKNANPNAALTDLGSADYAYLKSRGLDGNALAILQSHPATDDPGLFNELHRQATQDPVQFGQGNLLAHSGNLSQAHMKYLFDLQQAVNKQDPQAMQAGKQVEDAVGIVRSGLEAAGIPTMHIPDSSEGRVLASLEAGLRDHLIVAQQARKGAPLSAEEARSLALNYLADDALYGKGSIGKLIQGPRKHNL